MAILYRLTFPSNKCYIGITTKTLPKRCYGHIQTARAKNKAAVYNAIRKYGESFKREVLVVGNIDYLKELEIKAISWFKTLAPAGYNLSFGGDMSPLLNPIIAIKLKGNQHARNLTGIKKKRSPEYIAKLSESMKGNKNCLGKHWNFGNKFAAGKRTLEQIKRIKDGVAAARMRKQ